jgi:hypothetical protein
MRKCIAYCVGGSAQRPWIPCPRGAVFGSALCRTHADAVAGVSYGLGVLTTPSLPPTTARSLAQTMPSQDSASTAAKSGAAQPLSKLSQYPLDDIP